MFNIFEVEGLGKGLGAVGAKLSKSAGLPGVDVGSNVKAVQPQAKQSTQEQPQEQAPEQELTPEEQAAMAAEEQGPETVEKLPEPVELEYDKLGAPDKYKLTGHIVRRGGKEYVLDWDGDYDVYKLIDPETMIVKTRVRPSGISTVDFRSGTIRETISEAVQDIRNGVPISSLLDRLLNG